MGQMVLFWTGKILIISKGQVCPGVGCYVWVRILARVFLVISDLLDFLKPRQETNEKITAQTEEETNAAARAPQGWETDALLGPPPVFDPKHAKHRGH